VGLINSVFPLHLSSRLDYVSNQSVIKFPIQRSSQAESLGNRAADSQASGASYCLSFSLSGVGTQSMLAHPSLALTSVFVLVLIPDLQAKVSLSAAAGELERHGLIWRQ
jgi:hypothetical protein